MIRRLISVFLLLILLLSLSTSVLAVPADGKIVLPTEFPELPGVDEFSVPTKAALLVEMNTGTVLYSLDAEERNYPASLTKIMTCMLAIEHGNLEEMVTVSETALENLHAAGSTAELKAGEEMSLLNLLYCLMISSGNDAANVIAQHVSGDIPSFVKLMNDRAAELGCTSTHFANPHGLHDENHYTSAKDLCLIVCEAMKYPLFLEITNLPEYTVPATNLSEERTLYTTNMLISTSPNNNWRYSKASGIKTGFTTPAGRCLISTATDGNLDLLAIILGAETAQDALGDYSVYRSFPECINMCEYGFEYFSYSTVLTTLYPVAEIAVNHSAGSETVALSPAAPVDALVDKYMKPEDVELEINLVADSVNAPVSAGDILGTVTVWYNGQPLGTTDLTAITSVSRSEISHHVEQTQTYVASNWWKWVLGILLTIIILLLASIVLLHIRRRRMRRRKMEARRRALEMRRRMEENENRYYTEE